MVSPETMNSSIRIIHGPTASRPLVASRRSVGRGLGPDLEVVVEHRGLAVEQEAGVGEVAARAAGAGRRAARTRRRRNAWNGEYHSRSQWVWGTIATVVGVDVEEGLDSGMRTAYEPSTFTRPSHF